jgi:hypothetical protein
MKTLRIALAWATIFVVPGAHAGPGAHGPGGEHLDAPGAAVNASGLARLPDGSVNIPKLAQRRMGIRTAIAPVEGAAATVELPGRVIMNPNAGGRVQAHHGGRLEAGPRGFPVLGQAVRQGEVLVYTHHHADPYAAANQQAQLAELRANRTVAEQRVQRLSALEGTVPRKDIDAARAELQGLLERERTIGSSVNAREAMVAPVSGVIARADAIAGQVVETGHVLFEVVDPRQLMVEATTTDPTVAARIGGAALQGVPEARLKLLGAARSLRDGVLPITFEAASTDKAKGLPLAVGPARDGDSDTERTRQGHRAAGAGRGEESRQRADRVDQVRRGALHPAAGAIPGARCAVRWSSRRAWARTTGSWCRAHRSSRRSAEETTMFNWIVRHSLENRLFVPRGGGAAARVRRHDGVAHAGRCLSDLNKPLVTVLTEAGGLAPEEVEQLVTYPIETALNGMPGVTRVRSTSAWDSRSPTRSSTGAPRCSATARSWPNGWRLVREQLPPGVTPAIGPGLLDHGRDHADRAAARLGQGRGHADAGARVRRLRAAPRLLSVAGVSQVIPIGGEVRQLRVEPDTARMAQFGVTLTQVEQALRGFAGNTGGGFIDLNSREYLIRHLARTTRQEDLQGLAVAWKNGVPILLEQVAKVGFARR